MRKYLMIIMLMLLTSTGSQAQSEDYRAMMDEAIDFARQKEYAKSNECYQKIIDLLQGTESENLIIAVRNRMAINDLHQGVAALKARDFANAKVFLDCAITNANPDSKTFYMANSWMGQWYSVQSLNIRIAHKNLSQALEYCLNAEKYFDLAEAPEKRLREQVSRAMILVDMARQDEAEALLKQVVSECDGVASRLAIQGKALFVLGGIEVDAERFQSAIQHLEQSYDLCTKESESYAYMCANKLYHLYNNLIPDREKAALWKKRADDLEPLTVRE